MRKRSIQTKIVLLTTMGILICTILIGGISIYSFKKGMDESCREILHLTCSENANELNTMFIQIQQSVETLAKYSQQNLESIERLSVDKEYRAAYIQELKALALMLANETDGAVSVYIRFNPELTTPRDGVFWVELDKNEGFQEFQTTDLSAYEPDDMQHVGWYYVPVEAGHAVWVEPYMNEEIGVYVTSYVVPIYRDGILIGVVGMDIDFIHITQKLDQIHLYDTGHAFLTDTDFQVVYSKHLTKGDPVEVLKDFVTEESARSKAGEFIHIYNSVRRKLVFEELENGMHLAVTVPVYEVERDTNQLIGQVIGLATLTVMAFVILAIAIVRRIVRPLLELNGAAKEIAAGNLEIAVDCQTGDEVEMLAESLGETARQLKIRIDYINGLAFEDKLTGVKNNTAYLQELTQLKMGIQKGDCGFAVFIIDVNGLKQINDTLGHSSGNELIIKAARAATTVFGSAATFRIGGDEFAVIRRDVDEQAKEELVRAFEAAVKRDSGGIHLSAAIGGAVYDPAKDDCYESVFARADGEMYLKKQAMKERGETSHG